MVCFDCFDIVIFLNGIFLFVCVNVYVLVLAVLLSDSAISLIFRSAYAIRAAVAIRAADEIGDSVCRFIYTRLVCHSILYYWLSGFLVSLSFNQKNSFVKEGFTVVTNHTHLRQTTYGSSEERGPKVGTRNKLSDFSTVV